MKPYCEIVTSTVLPGIRSIITKELLTKYNMTQEEAAEVLGITQAAVSQYSREARGSKVKVIENDGEIMDMITDLTKNIVDKTFSSRKINESFCQICKKIREKKLICKLHEEIYPSIAPCGDCESC